MGPSLLVVADPELWRPLAIHLRMGHVAVVRSLAAALQPLPQRVHSQGAVVEGIAQGGVCSAARPLLR